MPKNKKYDAAVIGSGPNGLAAAITLAQAGRSVVLYEAKETVGGGMRSAELTLPGFVHDICSAIHPLGVGSPFFRNLPLHEFGLEWIQPLIPLAHPFRDGSAAILYRSVEKTADGLGIDAKAYVRLMDYFVTHWEALAVDLLAPLHFPFHPLLTARFALPALRSAKGLALNKFKEEAARGLFAGLAAHSILPLERTISASFGLVLGILGHAVGWPFPKGGAQKIADALAAYFKSLGGEIFTQINIQSIEELDSKVILCDITPRQLLEIAGKILPDNYARRLKKYRYGPGVFKIDWALSQPIPWKVKECLHAGTVHIGGTLEEIALSEREIWNGILPEKPFVLLAQQSLFDQSRAPEGKQTAWGYCHVPNGCSDDMTDRIETQIETMAPGFKDCILARHTYTPLEMEEYNSNYVGGDINGGVQDFGQLFARPVCPFFPYSTPVKGLYFCSSSTPPGGGVHGMCGHHAALSAIKNCF